jgi:hypothetical protein
MLKLTLMSGNRVLYRLAADWPAAVIAFFFLDLSVSFVCFPRMAFFGCNEKRSTEKYCIFEYNPEKCVQCNSYVLSSSQHLHGSAGSLKKRGGPSVLESYLNVQSWFTVVYRHPTGC